MAKASSSSSSPSISDLTFTKLHPFLQFVALLFIFLLLINLSVNPSPTMASSRPMKPSSESSSVSTKNLHPQKSQNPHNSSSSSAARREFGAEAHEVPSGPNPISNRLPSFPNLDCFRCENLEIQ